MNELESQIDKAWRHQFAKGQENLERDRALGVEDNCYSAQDMRDAFSLGFRAACEPAAPGRPEAWIKCSERLPASQELVLFFVGPTGHESGVYCGSRYAPNDSWSVAYDMYEGDHWDGKHVTLWMPMPSVDLPKSRSSR